MTATNSVGDSPASEKSNSVTPAVLPSVTGSEAGLDASGTSATVAITAAGNGAVITEYSAQLNDSLGGTRTVSSSSPRIVFDDLVPGRRYYLRTVTATNRIGATEFYNNSNEPIEPKAAPDTVTNVRSGIDGGTRAYVSFDLPTSYNGAGNISFTITAHDLTDPERGGQTATSPDPVSGLVAGHEYAFTVRVNSDMGPSRDSESSASVTAYGPPSQPASISASVDESGQKASVSFGEPSDSRGSAVSRYVLTASETPGCTGLSDGTDTTGLDCAVKRVEASSSPIDIEGLTLGKQYYFSVLAINDGGASEPAWTAPILAAALPGAPDAPAVQAGDRSATVAFSAPAGNGSAISRYVVTATDGSDSDLPPIQVGGAASPIEVTGLSNGHSYTFRVKAINGVGEGASSEPSDSATPIGAPPAPQRVAARPGRGDAPSFLGVSGTASVSFDEGNFNGSPTDRYRVIVTDTTGEGWDANQTLGVWAYGASAGLLAGTQGVIDAWHGPGGVLLHPGSAEFDVKSTPLSVHGLVNGREYSVSVVAINATGESEASSAARVTPGGLPDSPTDVAAIAGESSASIEFTAPAGNGLPITGYTVIAHDTASDATQTVTGSASPIEVRGLEGGRRYWFSVTANNAVGASSPVDTQQLTPSARPNAPVSLVASDSGGGAASVAFPAVVATPGVTKYSVTARDLTDSEAADVTVESGSSPVAVPGLTLGHKYVFTARATNALGTSAISARSNAVAPATVPDQPTAVQADPQSDASIVVTWDEPAIDGGLEIDSYVITASPGGKTCSVESVSQVCRFTTLTSGTPYTFSVRARNRMGLSPASDSSEAVTGVTVPGVPSDLAGVSQPDGVTRVSFTAPDPNGSPITAYTVLAYDMTDTEGETVKVSGTGSPIEIPDLVLGHTYILMIRATSAAGSGDWSEFSDRFTASEAPNAPTGVVAKRGAGSGSAEVSWTASSVNGSAVTAYKVTSSPGGKSCETDGAGRKCTVMGLENGTGYTFTVVATNGAGDGPASEASGPVTPTAVPAPTDVSASRGNASASVSWTAGTANDTPVTGYTVTSSPGGKTCTTDGSSTSCTVEELENGTEYSFTVVATSSIGNSDASAPSSSVLLATVPTAPQSVTATQQAKGSIRVAWERPASDGGAALTGYTATVVNASDLTTVLDTCQVGASANSCNLTGLEVGSAYDVRVVATNAAGDGAVSVVTPQVTVRSTPNAPTYVTASPDGDRSASVKWAYPSYNGTPATGYKVTSSPGGKTCTADSDSYIVVGFNEAIWETIWGAGCSVGDLSPNTDYTFTVVATSDVGDGDRSEASNSVRFDAAALGAPTAVSAVAGDASAEVSWTAPTDDGGSSITAYEATASVNGEPTDKSCQTGGAATSCTVEGLANGTEYTFTVVATNGDGTGPASEASNAVTPVAASVPGKAAITYTFAQSRSVTVISNKPAANRSPITGYTITASPGGKTCLSDAYAWGASCEVKGLTNGTAYTFTVVATNAKGDGEASDPSAPVTPTLAAWAPVGVSAVAGNGSALVSWTADTWGLRGFKVVASPGGRFCETEASSWTPRSCTVDGLTNGTEYTFTVIATNSWFEEGESDPSAPVTPAAPATAPGKATGVSAVAGDGSAEVSWTAAPANGSAVTAYNVTSSPGGKSCETGGAGRKCTVSDLENGTDYTFTVVASNAIGDGAGSDPSDAVTPAAPATAPGQPTGVSAVGGNASAEVSWTAPSSDGGSAITGYTVTAWVDDSKTDRTCSSSETSCKVEGLSNGTEYTFTVVATNAIGDGDASDESAGVTAGAVAGAPTDVEADPGDGSIDVSWTAPADNGGSAITGYEVMVSNGDNEVAACLAAADETRCTVAYLENGVAYTVRVRAENGFGQGPAGEAGPVTPSGRFGRRTRSAGVVGCSGFGDEGDGCFGLLQWSRRRLVHVFARWWRVRFVWFVAECSLRSGRWFAQPVRQAVQGWGDVRCGDRRVEC